MSVLASTLILVMATNPACGAAAPRSEFASRLQAIAIGESGGDPFAIRVNGPGGGPRHFPTAALAAAAAALLDAAGRDYDAGLMQINRRQFARHGLTRDTAFDPCQSMRAGAEHYADDVRAASIFSLAHRRYNTGGFERGAGYAASIEEVLARTRSVPAASAASEPIAFDPTAPAPCAPAWDAWALAECSARSAAPPPADPIPAAETVTTTLGTAHADQ